MFSNLKAYNHTILKDPCHNIFDSMVGFNMMGHLPIKTHVFGNILIRYLVTDGLDIVDPRLATMLS